MKRTIIAAGCLCLAMSCTKEPQNMKPEEDSRTYDVSVTVTDPLATKGISDDATGTIQVLVFDASTGALKNASTGEASPSFKLAAGSYHVWGLCAETLSSTALDGLTESKLTSTLTTFGDDLKDGSVLIPAFVHQDLSVPTSLSVSLPLVRRAAKVVLGTVTRSFNENTFGKSTVTVRDIYLSNAPVSCKIGNTSPVGWMNLIGVKGAKTSDVTWSLPQAYDSESDLASLTSSAKSKSFGKAFYCYPNSTSSDATSSQWSARKTRLVLKTVCTGSSSSYLYYTVTLPALVEGYQYSVALTLKQPGSPDPETYDPSSCTYSVTCSPISLASWNTGASLNESL